MQVGAAWGVPRSTTVRLALSPTTADHRPSPARPIPGTCARGLPQRRAVRNHLGCVFGTPGCCGAEWATGPASALTRAAERPSRTARRRVRRPCGPGRAAAGARTGAASGPVDQLLGPAGRRHPPHVGGGDRAGDPRGRERGPPSASCPEPSAERRAPSTSSRRARSWASTSRAAPRAGPVAARPTCGKAGDAVASKEVGTWFPSPLVWGEPLCCSPIARTPASSSPRRSGT